MECEGKQEYNSIYVTEFKGKKQHGVQIGYDSLWHKRDSTFFLDGKENGNQIFWDTLGNVLGRKSYRNGTLIGKEENYWAPGHPSVMKTYNAKGKEEGLWQEWWKNGNKKGEFTAKNGQIIVGTEYYPNGKPRIKYTTKYTTKPGAWLRGDYIDCEAWAPNGKPAGKIVKGNGEWLVFPSGEDSTQHTVFREVYKNTQLVKASELAPAEAAQWLKP